MILPKHIWQDISEPRKYLDKANMIGSGPYIFDRYDPASQTAYLKANPNYFAGKPVVDEIQYRYFKTEDSLVMALAKGEIDAIYNYYHNVPLYYVPTLMKNKNIDLGILPDGGIRYILYFNYRHPPLDNKKFREAISYAINYRELLNMFAFGYGEIPGRGYIPPSIMGYDPSIPKLKYDRNEAEKILDSLGFVKGEDGFRKFPDGKELRLSIVPQAYVSEAHERIAEAVCRYLNDIGINAYLDSGGMQDRALFVQKVFRNKDYDICIGMATPYGLEAHGGTSYMVDCPRATGTCADENFISLYYKVNMAKSDYDYIEAIKELQQYFNNELPGIALIWTDISYPHRVDKYKEWIFNTYTICYETWFNLKPVK